MDTRNNLTKVQGLIIGEQKYKEYDKLLTILTKDFGKIVVYAFGVRKINSKNIGKTRLFSFGTFELRNNGDKWTFENATIKQDYFNLTTDYDKVKLASYFIELANYFGYENVNESETLILLYYAFLALDKGEVENRLIKRVFELKILKYEGLYKEIDEKYIFGNALYINVDKKTIATFIYTWQFILTTHPKILFSFNLSDEVYDLFDREMSMEMREKVTIKLK